MKSSRLLLTALAMTFVACLAHAQERPPVAGSQEVAAVQSLALLRSLARERNAQELGFASAEEAARATLGAAMSVYDVGLDPLRKFKPGDDAGKLLEAREAAFYPVLLDGSVRASVRIEISAKGWAPARVGNTGLAVAVDKARKVLPAPEADVALVYVPALNLAFVGQKSAAGWLLVPVRDDASVDLRMDKAEAAASVFTRLAPIALQHDGEPS
jgi:hypothetical protein